MKRLIDDGYETARRILIEKNTEFERLAQGLLEYETLTGDEIKKVVAGEKLGGGDDADKPTSGGGLAAIPSIPKLKPKGASGLEPEPTA